ncbi:MAG: glycosyltransferase family 2 protein [Planctomyces sp.]|nr:glycosyltransferase family 2 protein [Planctomyces sp.]
MTQDAARDSASSPKVSVVLCAYNAFDRIAVAVESIRTQTFRDWELIVVDDGSTDRTGDVLDALAREDSRMRVIHQPNTGLTRALIRGCAEARGEYIARQDADDWSHPERLAEQVAYLDGAPDVGFASSWIQYVGPANEPLDVRESPVDPGEATRRLVQSAAGPPHGSVMMRRELYEAAGGYRAPFYFAQDHDLWLRFAERSRLGYVQKPLYHFRISLAAISSEHRPTQQRFGDLGRLCHSARQRQQSEEPYLQEALELTERVRGNRISESARRNAVIDTAYLVGSWLARKRDRRASNYLWKVIRHRPWDVKAWARLAQCYATSSNAPVGATTFEVTETGSRA